MPYLDEIRTALAAIAPGYQQPIHGFPPNEPAWVMREDAHTSAVFFCLPEAADNLVVYQEFANIRLQTIENHVNGAYRNCLVLHCLDHVQREKFALISEDFLNPGRRDFIAGNPSAWWREWSDLMGNSDRDQSPHAVLGELLVWLRMFQINQKMRWSGPDSSSHDIVGHDFDIEVKSTIKRYGKKVSISGEHQLSVANGKRLFLAFLRFEEGTAAQTINSAKNELINLGAADVDIENHLERMSYQRGRDTRSKKYALLEAELYHVTDVFPKITPASFIGGIIPLGLDQIKYEVDLSLLQPYATLDQFAP